MAVATRARLSARREIDPALRSWAARLETGRLCIAQSEMGQELIAELSAFEVNYTRAAT
jgi:hypothetical protein